MQIVRSNTHPPGWSFEKALRNYAVAALRTNIAIYAVRIEDAWSEIIRLQAPRHPNLHVVRPEA